VAAARALSELEKLLDSGQEAFSMAKKSFAAHAQTLSAAQQLDKSGHGLLLAAKDKLATVHGDWQNIWRLGIGYHGDDVQAAHQTAVAGIDERRSAAESARTGAEAARQQFIHLVDDVLPSELFVRHRDGGESYDKLAEDLLRSQN
jgi:hypothetical protein